MINKHFQQSLNLNQQNQQSLNQQRTHSISLTASRIFSFKSKYHRQRRHSDETLTDLTPPTHKDLDFNHHHQNHQITQNHQHQITQNQHHQITQNHHHQITPLSNQIKLDSNQNLNHLHSLNNLIKSHHSKKLENDEFEFIHSPPLANLTIKSQPTLSCSILTPSISRSISTPDLSLNPTLSSTSNHSFIQKFNSKKFKLPPPPIQIPKLLNHSLKIISDSDLSSTSQSISSSRLISGHRPTGSDSNLLQRRFAGSNWSSLTQNINPSHSNLMKPTNIQNPSSPFKLSHPSQSTQTPSSINSQFIHLNHQSTNLHQSNSSPSSHSNSSSSNSDSIQDPTIVPISSSLSNSIASISSHPKLSSNPSSQKLIPFPTSNHWSNPQSLPQSPSLNSPDLSDLIQNTSLDSKSSNLNQITSFDIRNFPLHLHSSSLQNHHHHHHHSNSNGTIDLEKSIHLPPPPLISKHLNPPNLSNNLQSNHSKNSSSSSSNSFHSRFPPTRFNSISSSFSTSSSFQANSSNSDHLSTSSISSNFPYLSKHSQLSPTTNFFNHHLTPNFTQRNRLFSLDDSTIIQTSNLFNSFNQSTHQFRPRSFSDSFANPSCYSNHPPSIDILPLAIHSKNSFKSIDCSTRSIKDQINLNSLNQLNQIIQQAFKIYPQNSNRFLSSNLDHLIHQEIKYKQKTQDLHVRYLNDLKKREKLLQRHVTTLKAFNGDQGARFAESLIKTISQTDQLTKELLALVNLTCRIQSTCQSHWRAAALVQINQLQIKKDQFNQTQSKIIQLESDSQAHLNQISNLKIQLKNLQNKLDSLQNSNDPSKISNHSLNSKLYRDHSNLLINSSSSPPLTTNPSNLPILRHHLNQNHSSSNQNLNHSSPNLNQNHSSSNLNLNHSSSNQNQNQNQNQIKNQFQNQFQNQNQNQNQFQNQFRNQNQNQNQIKNHLFSNSISSSNLIINSKSIQFNSKKKSSSPNLSPINSSLSSSHLHLNHPQQLQQKIEKSKIPIPFPRSLTKTESTPILNLKSNPQINLNNLNHHNRLLNLSRLDSLKLKKNLLPSSNQNPPLNNNLILNPHSSFKRSRSNSITFFNNSNQKIHSLLTPPSSSFDFNHQNSSSNQNLASNQSNHDSIKIIDHSNIENITHSPLSLPFNRSGSSNLSRFPPQSLPPPSLPLPSDQSSRRRVKDPNGTNESNLSSITLSQLGSLDIAKLISDIEKN